MRADASSKLRNAVTNLRQKGPSITTRGNA